MIFTDSWFDTNLDYSSATQSLWLSSRARASPRTHQACFWLDALAGPSRGTPIQKGRLFGSFHYRGPSTPRPPDLQKRRVGKAARSLRSEAVTKFGFQSAAGKLGFVAGGG